MRRRRILTGLAAAALAASMSFIAGPAGAVLTNACTEGMNPAMQANASSLHVDCTFTATGHFVTADIGRFISGGSLPDGGTIATVVSTTQVTIACAGCLGS